MKKTILIVVIIACFVLSSCKTAEQKAVEAQEINRLLGEKEISECKELGYKPKTKSFAECRLKVRQIYMSIAQQQANAEMISQQNAARSMGQAFQNYGNAIASQSYYRPVHTNCYNVGKTVNCTTY